MLLAFSWNAIGGMLPEAEVIRVLLLRVKFSEDLVCDAHIRVLY